jgi:TPP-dependent 2-oxoacid decarboxylase
MHATNQPLSIGDYLIAQLRDHGVSHVFGIPGDYILSFYSKLAASSIKVINTCDEQGAGFAADAYARLNGLGVVCVTYNAGGLKLVNTTAQAYAEEVPVLVIAGAPGWGERQKYPLLHHKVKDYEDQLKIFEHITIASITIQDPEEAFNEINRIISEIEKQKRPGFIELPRDMVNVVPKNQPSFRASSASKSASVAQERLSSVASKAIEVINSASQPVIVAGVEVARYGLENSVVEFAKKANIPIVSTFLGKSAVAETNPLYLGIYAGIVANEAVRQYVESSDCVILVGVLLTDIDLGSNTAKLEPYKMLTINSDSSTINNRSFPVGLDLLRELTKNQLSRHDRSHAPPSLKERTPEFEAKKQRITAKRLFEAIGSFVDKDTVVIADIGDSVCGCLEVPTQAPRRFLSPTYYSSLGFSIPASIGVQAKHPELRPLVVIGDGGFQMTGIEISTAIRNQMNPIVIVLNNNGFGTERPMMDGPFNDVARWNFHELPKVFNSDQGFLIRTEKELVKAYEKAKRSSGVSILEVILEPNDISPQLQKLCSHMLGKKQAAAQKA